MTKADIKQGIRYVILACLMVLAYKVVTPEYLIYLKELSDVVAAAVIASVYGALTLVLKSNFETKTSN